MRRHDDQCQRAWAGKIAALAGIPVRVIPGKGVMVAVNHRLVNTVINRCKMPADGDILVPVHTVAIIGTTDERVSDPEMLSIRAVGSGIDAGGRGKAGARFQQSAHLAGVGGRASALPGRLRRRQPRRHARAGAARPSTARWRRRLPHHHWRQVDDLPADGGDDGGQGVRPTRRQARLPHGGYACSGCGAGALLAGPSPARG
jgi:hypothetical protein